MPQLTPQRQRQNTLEAILALLLAHAAQQPVLFIVEDLHWIDPSTLELLSLFIDQGPRARILTLFTARPEFHPPWDFQAHVTSLTLDRLPPMQVELMIERVTGGKRLPSAVRQQVVAKTDGVPLFVEELTKTVIESGLLREQADHYELPSSLPSLAIPTTLHDSLMARLDRLAHAKEVAQLGATLGRAFPYELLQEVSPWDEDRLQQALDHLVEAELLYQRGVPPQVTYVFKHALIQETAYQSLLKSQRQQYHQRTAPILELHFPEIAETQPELLAHHYKEANLPAQALPYWQRAGQRAVERSANVEAISHFTKGLEVIEALPDTLARTQQELALQLALGPPLRVIKGHTALDVESVYSRAYELSQQVGDSQQQFSALAGLERFYINRAMLQKAHELGEQCLTLAQRMQDPVFRIEAHRMLGLTSFYLGELVMARRHLEQGIALYDVQQGYARAFGSGMAPGVVCLSVLARTLWQLGYPDQALTKSREALTLAHELSHAYSLAFALHYDAVVRLSRREVSLAQERIEAIVALSCEHGFAQWMAGGMFMSGWALVEQGTIDEGIVQLKQAQAMWQAMGTELAHTHIAVRLTEAHCKKGQIAEGLHIVDEALGVLHKNAEYYYAAELHRLKGELFLQQSIQSNGTGHLPLATPMEGEAQHAGVIPVSSLQMQAEACFRQALDIARQQCARSLELRAVMSLSRLWQQQGKPTEARQILTQVYNWFTEGLDTPELQEAKALLQALT